MYAVRDLMRVDVVTLGEDDRLGTGDALLSLRAVRHLPVLRGRQVVGVVTYRDVLEACLARGAVSDGLRAAEVMAHPVYTVQPGEPLRHAARRMLQERIGCLPVVDAAGDFLGILTEADLVRFALEIVTDFDHVANGLTASVHETEH